MSENKYGVTEFADTLGDFVLLIGEDGVRSAFKKGSNFEVIKLLVETAEAYPTVKEMVDDSKTFFQEAADLKTFEKDEVISLIKRRFPDPDPVQAKVIEFYEVSGFAFVWVVDSVAGGAQTLIAMVKTLFGRTAIE